MVPLIDLSIRGHIGLVVDVHLYFLAGLLGVLWDGVTAFGKLGDYLINSMLPQSTTGLRVSGL